MKRIVIAIIVLCCNLTAANAQSETYDTNRGFRHPGGLHTQEDFDRIKAQLAAGNEQVTAAYNVLKTAAYAQPSVGTNPVETIVRGGGSGENYINAARGATMAYQNALRWKIEGNEACAKGAVRILMSWARTTKAIGGDSNYALAAGLYGYQFAQAAELMRDYEGWSDEEFRQFKQWMLSVWYPSAIGFLRGRNGTWENASKWWQAPGHYWSNWGLCNALCVASIGVLCDDVFIYNQGMSYFKYDQVGTFTATRNDNPIKNDGLTEFLGNLVVTTTASPLETGAYGMLGQMNESGRDTGHSAMALGLAIDLAKQGWNQGDDLFAYMDHRLAAGIEYVAAQTQSVEGLPWRNYAYGTNGYYYTDSRVWVMTGPALGAQMRPYWGTVIGIYEGIKGIQMPFSDDSYSQMGIDAGGQGSTSGGYDHLGYSILMNTRNKRLASPEDVPTELSPMMEYSGTFTGLVPSISVEQALGNISGKTIRHSELGGLINTFQTNNKTGLPKGQTVKLMPQLPEGEEDTGLWTWNTGETTRNITVTTDKSYVYRVTYTNKNGVKSEQMFALAVQGDCNPSPRVTGSITYNGTTTSANEIEIFCGEKVTLTAEGNGGYGTYKWNSGQTTAAITTPAITKDTEYTVTYTNQGGAKTEKSFRIHVKYCRPDIIVNGESRQDTVKAVVTAGDNVTIGPFVPTAVTSKSFSWSTGETTPTVTFSSIQESKDVTLDCTLNGNSYSFHYTILVNDGTSASHIDNGDYYITLARNGYYLTKKAGVTKCFFADLSGTEPGKEQTWHIYDASGTDIYNIQACIDSTFIRNTLNAGTSAPAGTFFIQNAMGTQLYALRARSQYYLLINNELKANYNTEKALTDFPFMLTLVRKDTDGITTTTDCNDVKTTYTSPSGLKSDIPFRGINIVTKTRKDGSRTITKQWYQ